jgi:hypothetical protein
MTADVRTEATAVTVSHWWRVNPDTGLVERGRLIKRGTAWEVWPDGRETVRRATETAALVEVRAIIGDAWVWQTVNPERRRKPRAGR